MSGDFWAAALVAALAVNAVLGFSYRVYRLARGGPVADAIGQAVLGALLVALATCVALEMGWAVWGALVYGVVFGIVVMPLWTMGVLIPMRPGRLDLVFTGVYWFGLVVTIVAAVAV
jgi:hypothetical protein